MHSLSALTVYIFGISAFLLGIYNLTFPEAALIALELPVDAASAMNGNALAAIAMGVYYILGAYQRNRIFFLLTVLMRSLTAAVFWIQGGPWRVASMWEAAGAAATAGALLWEGF